MRQFKNAFLVVLISSFGVSALAAPAEKLYNFSFSPLTLLIGGVAGGLEYKITPEWTVGPELTYVNYSVGRTGSLTKDISIKATVLGARGNWYKNGVYTDGLYLSPGLNYSDLSLSTADSSGSITAAGTGLFLKGIAGYGWFWESFNMHLGAGISIGMGSSKVTVKDSTGTTTEEVDMQRGFAAEWTMGWTF